jgi:hypothetical protein
MPRAKFVIYERVKYKAPTFSAVIDVGDKIYRFEAKLDAQQGRSSLVGTLSEIHNKKIREVSEMPQVLPSGPLLEGHVESDTVAAPGEL